MAGAADQLAMSTGSTRSRASLPRHSHVVCQKPGGSFPCFSAACTLTLQKPYTTCAGHLQLFTRPLTASMVCDSQRVAACARGMRPRCWRLHQHPQPPAA